MDKKQFCEDKRNLTDMQIAMLLIKLPEYKNNKPQSLRRQISEIRTAYGMRDKSNIRNKMLNDFLDIEHKYPGKSTMFLSSQLHLKYPQYTTKTLRNYVTNYRSYGIFES